MNAKQLLGVKTPWSDSCRTSYLPRLAHSERRTGAIRYIGASIWLLPGISSGHWGMKHRRRPEIKVQTQSNSTMILGETF